MTRSKKNQRKAQPTSTSSSPGSQDAENPDRSADSGIGVTPIGKMEEDSTDLRPEVNNNTGPVPTGQRKKEKTARDKGHRSINRGKRDAKLVHDAARADASRIQGNQDAAKELAGEADVPNKNPPDASKDGGKSDRPKKKEIGHRSRHFAPGMRFQWTDKRRVAHVRLYLYILPVIIVSLRFLFYGSAPMSIGRDNYCVNRTEEYGPQPTIHDYMEKYGVTEWYNKTLFGRNEAETAIRTEKFLAASDSLCKINSPVVRQSGGGRCFENINRYTGDYGPVSGGLCTDDYFVNVYSPMACFQIVRRSSIDQYGAEKPNADEIMRHMKPYIRMCIEFATHPIEDWFSGAKCDLIKRPTRTVTECRSNLRVVDVIWLKIVLAGTLVLFLWNVGLVGKPRKSEFQFRFLRFYEHSASEEDDEDLDWRPDSIGTADLKHKDSVMAMCLIQYRPSWKFIILPDWIETGCSVKIAGRYRTIQKSVISVELLTQISTAKVLSVMEKPSVVKGNIAHAAANFSTVNIDRHCSLMGQDVSTIVNNTISAAYYLYLESLWRNRKVDFLFTPVGVDRISMDIAMEKSNYQTSLLLRMTLGVVPFVVGTLLVVQSWQYLQGVSFVEWLNLMDVQTIRIQ
jgi:hypothetical protein